MLSFSCRAVPLLAAISRPSLTPRCFGAPLACAASSGTESSGLAPVLAGWLDSTLSNERRKRASLAKEAEAARKAEKLGQWATLVIANLYRIDDRATSVVVEDWDNGGQPTELRFDQSDGTPREQADKAFVKARKLRRGSAIIAGLIEESEATEVRLMAWQARVLAAEEAQGSDADAALGALRAEMLREAKKLKLKATALERAAEGGGGGGGGGGGAQGPGAAAGAGGAAQLPRGKRDVLQDAPLAPSRTPGWGGREFVSPGGVPILVGRNRKENEQLSLKVCREPDVWFHVRGVPGAHVVLQMSRVKGKAPPSDECLQMAADLAAFYSEARDETKALVTLASPRHVTKPKGAPLGAVKLREEAGTLLGRPMDSELIPPEIMAARERERFGGGPSPVQSGGGAKKWS